MEVALKESLDGGGASMRALGRGRGGLLAAPYRLAAWRWDALRRGAEAGSAEAPLCDKVGAHVGSVVAVMMRGSMGRALRQEG